MIEADKTPGIFVWSYAGKRIAFRIERRKRTKLAITVHPGMRLEVVAPLGADKKEVLHRVHRRSSWILKQWRYFEQFQPIQPDRRYVSGETVQYLGRHYRLKLHKSAINEVKLSGRFLHVWTKKPLARSHIQALVEGWYREHAARLFAHRLTLILNDYPSLGGATSPRTSMRRMRNRWGSCARTGKVLLNPELVKAPVHCIDYVILHELCHLKVQRHSPTFYRLLSRHMPDWEQRKRRLNNIVLH